MSENYSPEVEAVLEAADEKLNHWCGNLEAEPFDIEAEEWTEKADLLESGITEIKAALGIKQQAEEDMHELLEQESFSFTDGVRWETLHRLGPWLDGSLLRPPLKDSPNA